MRVSPSMPTSVVRAMLRLTLLGAAVLLLVVRVENKEVDKFIPLGGESKIPVLGYGTYGANNEELEKALDEALEAGYRHIDTATVYENEAAIGKVINRWITSGKVNRSDLFIVTKLPGNGLTPQYVPHFLKKSLEKLQVDYVDLYLIHSPVGLKYHGDEVYYPKTPEGLLDIDVATDHVAVWKAMEEQVDLRRAKNIGLSNFNVRQIGRILNNSRIAPANHQIEIHAYYQQNELVEYCKNNNISVTAYSPLGSPGLSKLEPGIKTPNILGNPVVNEIAKNHNKTAAQVLLRHLIQNGLITIPKSVTPSRIKDNINIFDFELSELDMAKLNSLDKGQCGIIPFTGSPGIEKHPEYI